MRLSGLLYMMNQCLSSSSPIIVTIDLSKTKKKERFIVLVTGCKLPMGSSSIDTFSSIM
jgi:hypothetical protein